MRAASAESSTAARKIAASTRANAATTSELRVEALHFGGEISVFIRATMLVSSPVLNDCRSLLMAV